MILEACVNSAISAIEAQSGGADRVELCENMPEGGCTPSAGTIAFARKHLHIDLFVMIRPRGADFLYSDDEFEIMKRDILMAKSAGADGVVFGILKPDGTIDKERMGELAGLARPMGVTCHRAFDMTTDPFAALEDLISIGIDRVLTSGQSDSALAGAPLLKRLIELGDKRIIVMPGHGIKEFNFKEVIEATGAREFHLYLPKKMQSKMDFQRNQVAMGAPDLSEYEIIVVDREKVRMAKEILMKMEDGRWKMKNRG
jgi:copper homeostasis protein